jgi:exopolyphosphatase/guanosine-5'-triphosphate,3'-diphosphate pyrophosphatase
VTGGPVRLAAILVGTNTTRCMVVEADARNSYRLIDSERVNSRLGEGLGSRGEIAPEAMERTLEALRRFVGIAHAFRAETTRVVATSAAREASNGPDFVRRARDEAGVEIEVVSGEEEARLAWRSAAAEFDLAEGRSAILDIGGGSAEVLLVDEGEVRAARSLPVGALRLTERFVEEDPMSPGAFRKMRDHIRDHLEDFLGSDGLDAFETPVVIGSGGTVSALVRAALGPSVEGYATLHGLSIDRDRVKDAVRALRGMSFDDRRRLPGISPERAEILVPGIVVVREALRALEARRLVVNELGIREGIILDMIDQAFPDGSASSGAAARTPAGVPARDEWLGGVIAFAEKVRFEKDHSLHVAHLAGLLFDALAPMHDLAPRDRDLLQSAAILHDIGHVIDYKGHHRHACDMIQKARIPGLTPGEVRTIALVVRYHRGANPKVKHPEFGSLPREDRERVRRLAALLRVADGLDRGHVSCVQSLGARLGNERVEIVLVPRSNPDLEIWGAARKAALFEEVFEREIVFRSAAAVEAVAAARSRS